MSKNFKYRNKPCGYCGKNTGNAGEGEHVLPKAMYPQQTDSNVQYAKIPSCPECNNSWQRDEAHFRTVIDMCGPNLTPERREVWEKARRSFQRPNGGTQDRLRVAEMLVPHSPLGEDKGPSYKIFPLQDQRVVRVLRKIVRGLVHRQTGEIIKDESLVQFVNQNVEEIREDADDLIKVVYDVPRVFRAWAYIHDSAVEPDLHSAWGLKFYGSALFGAFLFRPAAFRV